MTERYYLGIDGGGTKTAAVVLDAESREIGRGAGGPGNVATADRETLAASLRDAVSAACAAGDLPWDEIRFAGVCAGVAGYSLEARRTEFMETLSATVPSDSFRVEPDYVVAYWGATLGEPGIVVVAGTGAVTFGRNAQGQSGHVDGLGYLLGDRGSGFDLGLHVLRHTLERMTDGSEDALTRAVLDYTGARNQNDLMHWLYGAFSPARVASLSSIVGPLAEAGDSAARLHVAEMAHRLRHAVRQIRHKLWLPPETPVYPLGGLWAMGPFFRAEFALPQIVTSLDSTFDPIALQGGRFEIRSPQNDASFGAALLALAEEQWRFR